MDRRLPRIELRRGQVVLRGGEEDASETVLGGPVSVTVAMPLAVDKVLRHRLVGVAPHLGQAGCSCPFVGEIEQVLAYARPGR